MKHNPNDKMNVRLISEELGRLTVTTLECDRGAFAFEGCCFGDERAAEGACAAEARIVGLLLRRRRRA